MHRSTMKQTRRSALTSIIIPCWNQLRYTEECVRSLLARTRQPYELILIDNGSVDGTARFLRGLAAEHPFIRPIRNRRNLGFARAVNQGMALSRGKYVVWLNNDAVVTPNWLERMIRCAEAGRRTGAVGPYTNDAGFQNVPAPYQTLDELPVFSEAWAMLHAGKSRPIRALDGFCMLLKRHVVQRIGPLDERFGLGYYEDSDYCLRLRQRGYALILAEDVFIHHHGHKSFGSRKGPAMAANQRIFSLKWGRKAMEFPH